MAVHQMELGPGLLDIGELAALTSLASQVTKCTLKPKTNEDDDIPVLSGEIVPGDFTTTWTLEGEFLQDFGTESTKAISEWTFTNSGKVFPFTFTPNNVDGTKKLTGLLRVAATDIGGDVGKRNSAAFSFKVIGKPEIAALA